MTREQIIEAMARAICESVGGISDSPTWATLATAALDAALPLLADEAFRWDTGRLAAEALRSLAQEKKP